MSIKPPKGFEMEISELASYISGYHKCVCYYLYSVEVHQLFKDRVLWTGSVSVFMILGHSLATECYGWVSQELSGTDEPVVILKLGKVDSPKAAVREYICKLSEAL